MKVGFSLEITGRWEGAGVEAGVEVITSLSVQLPARAGFRCFDARDGHTSAFVSMRSQ